MATPRRKAIKSARKAVKVLKKGRRKYVRKGDPTLTKNERKDVVALRELRSGTLKKAKEKLKKAKKVRKGDSERKMHGAVLVKTKKGRPVKTKAITSKRASRIKNKKGAEVKKVVGGYRVTTKKGKKKNNYKSIVGYKTKKY